jgi:hypothetical protein
LKTIGQIPTICFDTHGAEQLFVELSNKLDNTNTVIQWSSFDGRGNCFFATTDMFIKLFKADIPAILQTGIFIHDNEEIYHAWIEFKTPNGDYVLNVSNLFEKPAYIIQKDKYYKINNIKEKIETITFGKLKHNLTLFKLKSRRKKVEFNRRNFTRFILQKTIKKLSIYLHDSNQS